MKLVNLFLFATLIFSLNVAAEESKLPKLPELPKTDLIHSKLNSMMQNTASWLDTIENENSEGASANGYLQLSWLPRTADLSTVDAKFKVYFNLPHWNNKLALVIDNSNEDERLLNYETNYAQKDQEGVNVAIQYIKQFNNDWKIKNRVGISRKQLYLRSDIKFDWTIDNLDFSFQPRVDYFMKDGWGPSVKGVVNYALDESYLSMSASIQKLERESRSRDKIGLFYIKDTGENQLLVTGVQYVQSNDKLDVSNKSYSFSTRYRNLLYKSWMYFEVEPFIEFNELHDYKREFGIVFNLVNYYGD